MRPVMHGDLTALARHLLILPPPRRPAACARLMAQADAADRYRKRFGRAHPAWGNGTLMARALATAPPPEPRLQDPDYAACLALVLTQLAARHTPDAGFFPMSRLCVWRAPPLSGLIWRRKGQAP